MAGSGQQACIMRMANFIYQLLLTAMFSWAFAARAAEPETGKTSFGFTGPETYPIDNFIGELRTADLDGDGLIDLIVSNNSRSRINLLYNQTGKTNEAEAVAPVFKRQINELPPDTRFRIESIASEKRISALVVADLNSDGRPDLAYYGEPKELVVQYNQGSNTWSAPKRWPIEDGQLTPNALTSGDLNGDGRADLVLLAENHLYLLPQNSDRSLVEPERIPFSGAVKSVQVLDIDGNGRDDLLLVNWETSNPFRFRLQNASGSLGPETHFSMPPIRSYWADDLDGNHRTEIITIALSSGRAQISNFVRKPSEPLYDTLRQGQFQVLPLNKTTKARRGMAWADLDGDQLTDLIVAEPDSGQLTVFLQQSDGSLARGRTFPTLTGVSDLAVVSGSKDKPAEIFVLSQEERQLGLTRYDKQGRIPFPTNLGVEGRPLIMAVGSLKPKEKPSLAAVVDQDGRRTLYLRGPDGQLKTQGLSDSFKSNPAALAFHDVNQDGLADLVVLIPYEKIKILLQVAGKDFEEQDVAPPGGTVDQPWLSTADVDGDGKAELLLAQKNFLRAVVLQTGQEPGSESAAPWTFAVKDQINGTDSNSRIVAATPLQGGSNGVAPLFLLDAERKVLTLCARDPQGVWRVVRNVPLPFSEFNQLHPLALGGRKPNSVAFMGLNAVSWMGLGGETWSLAELDGYETSIRDGHLHDVISGDLNKDGRKDLVFLETSKNYLDVVIYDKDRKLVPAARWQVFEQRSFRGRPSELPEPREASIVDVTGDGKSDLVVLVHDRILVYPQE